MKLQNRVALRIKTIRNRRKWTQEVLAEKVGRTADAISQLERGLSLPSFETLERLAEALKVPVRDFFDGDHVEGESQRREATIANLLDAARALSDADLDIAAQIVEVIAARKSAR